MSKLRSAEINDSCVMKRITINFPYFFSNLNEVINSPIYPNFNSKHIHRAVTSKTPHIIN